MDPGIGEKSLVTETVIDAVGAAPRAGSAECGEVLAASAGVGSVLLRRPGNASGGAGHTATSELKHPIATRGIGTNIKRMRRSAVKRSAERMRDESSKGERKKQRKRKGSARRKTSAGNVKKWSESGNRRRRDSEKRR